MDIQRLLFRRAPHPHLQFPDRNDNGSRAIPLLRTLRSSPHLIAHIRFIHIVFSSYFRNIMERTTPEALANVALLELCPHVEGISLFIPNDFYTVDWRLWDIPLSPVFLQVSAEYELINEVTELWPSVRTLVVDAFSLPNWDWGGPNSISFPPTVQSLVHRE
ncbi:hypothetical protein FA95DRAFT_673833 [Auriscalpium vulgare]|uniref:Uncharacterized protein n=1 Tax=Auriscalpium vulgare TaxID=40419 RepID=A0ACB8RBT4_9AGAM|nr:hypothetical protein FA95DRAFT_673833 [Auriscalpium vulgare]